MPSVVARRYLLDGEVQGVGCRAQVLQLMHEIGHLAGWVRNLPDGRVEVCVKGPDWRVSDAEKTLREGMLAPVRIRSVVVEELPADFSAAGFVIRRD